MLCFMTLTGGLIYAFFTPMVGERILGIGIIWVITLIGSLAWADNQYQGNFMKLILKCYNDENSKPIIIEDCPYNILEGHVFVEEVSENEYYQLIAQWNGYTVFGLNDTYQEVFFERSDLMFIQD